MQRRQMCAWLFILMNSKAFSAFRQRLKSGWI
ncbi:hypothetical protein Pvag_1531 [Pantoea vagans C9-1]|nr:hypothetical protein Pvag_1531 [Pantoea vagans C9-1]